MEEVRVLPANVLRVQGGDNGGILVCGSDNKEIVIVACKSTWAQDEAAAQHLLNQLALIIQNQEVRAEGPAKGREHHVAGQFYCLRATKDGNQLAHE
jgi:hypothetical protein